MALQRKPSKSRSALGHCKESVKGIQEYKYQPLKGSEIRLVQLLPGAFDDDIHIQIVHEEFIVPDEAQTPKPTSKQDVQATLPEGWEACQNIEGQWYYRDDGQAWTYQHPTVINPFQLEDRSAETVYESLSYAWGNTARNCTVYVQATSSNNSSDKQHGSVLRVTSNLDTALRHLRYETDPPRILWIDAICIDQSSNAECSAQVLRIPSIYKHASRVVAWLGPANHDSELALSLLELLGRQLEITLDGLKTQAPNAEHPEWWKGRTALPFSTTQWRALEHLFERPFFERLWVLQEIYLANRHSVWQCGLHAIPWRNARRAIAALLRKIEVPNVIEQASVCKIAVASGSKLITIQDVIFLARKHKCSRPHDNLYGTVAFLGSQLQQSIQPSYERRYDEAYQKLFLEHSKITERLDLLTECFLSDHFDAPSWVPDLRGYPYNCATACRWNYQASGMSPASYEFVSPNVLAAKGRIYENIIQVLPHAAGEDDDTLLEKLDELFTTFPIDSPYITGQSMLDVWALTFSLEIVPPRVPNTYSRRSLQELKEALANFVNQTAATSAARISKLDVLDSNWKYNLANMNIFIVEGGFIGLGSVNVRKNDIVCVLLGLNTPLVIRQRDTCYYQVVGWCYILGLMDGEALLGPLQPDWSVKIQRHGYRYRPSYIHQPVGNLSRNDPRLGPLPDEWVRIDQEATKDDPLLVEFFKNSVTGEVINYDPRMTAEMLEQRGVQLDTINLV